MDAAEESLEAHDRPEDSAAVASAGLVLGEKAAQESDIEQARIGQRRARKGRLGAPAQGSAKPGCQRYREALLGPIEERAWNVGLERPLEDVLALTVSQLAARRDSGGPFHQLVIEQRGSDLQRIGHAGAVDLGQNI